MNPGLEGIVAEVIYHVGIRRPDFTDTHIEPGMVALYNYNIAQQRSKAEMNSQEVEMLNSLLEAKKRLVQIIAGKRSSTRQDIPTDIYHRPLFALEDDLAKIESEIRRLSTKSVPQSAQCVVTKVVFNWGDWEAYLDGVNGSVPIKNLHPVGWSSQIPNIRANEAYEVIVPGEQSFFGYKFTRRGIKKARPTGKVLATVLAQSALGVDSVVYLRDPNSTEVYVVRASDLPQREISRQFTAPKMYAAGVVDDVKDTRRDIAKDVDNQIQGEQKQLITFSSPVDIADKLGGAIKSQDYAVRSVSIAVYDHLVRPQGVKKSNILIIGPTGSGKTEMARQVAEMLGVPFVESKLSGKSATGFKGENLVNIFIDLHRQKDNPIINRSVIFLDEFDKIAQGQLGEYGFGPTLQDELIGWVESARVTVPTTLTASFHVDTTNMLFIAAGAFAGYGNRPGLEDYIARRVGIDLSRYSGTDKQKIVDELLVQVRPEDLIQYGFKPELLGRFPVITHTRQLDKDALVDIIKNSSKSVFNQQVRLLREGYKVSVEVDEGVYKIVADAALRHGTGARGLESVSVKLFENIKFGIRAGTTNLQITEAYAYETLKQMLPPNYRS